MPKATRARAKLNHITFGGGEKADAMIYLAGLSDSGSNIAITVGVPKDESDWQKTAKLVRGELRERIQQVLDSIDDDFFPPNWGIN